MTGLPPIPPTLPLDKNARGEEIADVMKFEASSMMVRGRDTGMEARMYDLFRQAPEDCPGG